MSSKNSGAIVLAFILTKNSNAGIHDEEGGHSDAQERKGTQIYSYPRQNYHICINNCFNKAKYHTQSIPWKLSELGGEYHYISPFNLVYMRH